MKLNEAQLNAIGEALIDKHSLIASMSDTDKINARNEIMRTLRETWLPDEGPGSPARQRRDIMAMRLQERIVGAGEGVQAVVAAHMSRYDENYPDAVAGLAVAFADSLLKTLQKEPQ